MKRLMVLFGFIFWFSSLISQSIHFNYTDGSSSEYELEDVRKITFEGDVMQLHLNDGSQYNWNVSTIGHYQYEESSPSTNIEQILELVNFLEVTLYPNPVKNDLNISFNLPFSDNVSLEIYDYSGRLLIKKNLGRLDKGNQLYQLNINELKSGIYVLNIIGDKSSISKNIIKK
tara:strand:- start:90 stop:608 length:519 start_codon:yes stop_codon:yes gene_type:complete